MAIKSILKPEGSLVLGGATVALTVGLYTGLVGPMSMAHQTDANSGNLSAARKKAGYTALVGIAAIGLLSKDANIVILGGATIIAMELGYRHAIMAHPETGAIVPPAPTTYQPAENVVPINQQGSNVAYG